MTSAFLAVLAGLASTSYVVVAALAAPAEPSGRIGDEPPAAPLITAGPTNPSTDTSPEFTFTDNSHQIQLYCYLDALAAMPCTGDTDDDGGLWNLGGHDADGDQDFISWRHGEEDGRKARGEWQFANLAPGAHCLYVYAVSNDEDKDQFGDKSPVTSFCWTITAPATNFTVGGNLTTPLYPATSQPLDLTFTNPNSSAITIASNAITSSNITITTNKASCAGSNFAVAQGLTTAVTIPANATAVSLHDLGVPQANWPVIAMLDTHTNQDACQGATLTLTYSGIEATG